MRLLLLRTTAARWLAPLGAAIAAGALILDHGWEGSWGDTTLRATTQLLLLLPLVMIAGALDAGRLLRPATQPSAVSAARSPAAVVAQLTAAVAVWGLGSYLFVLVIGYAVTAKTNPLLPPPVPWVWIVAGAGAVVAHAGLGVLLGRVVPVLVALALSGLVGLVGNAVLAAGQGSVAALFSVADAAFLGGAMAPRPVVQLLQAGFFLLVAATAIALTAIAVRRTRGAVATGAVIGLLTVSTAVGLAATGGEKTRWLSEADGPRTCTPDGVVCLWSDHGFLAPGYAALGRAMLEDAPESVPTSGWTETGLTRASGHTELYVAGNRPSVNSMAIALADGVLDQLAPRRALEDSRWQLAETWLAAKVLDGNAQDEFVTTYGSPVSVVLAQPPDVQWVWFSQTVHAMRR